MMALLRQSESVVRKYKNELKFYMRDTEQQLRNEIMAKANKGPQPLVAGVSCVIVVLAGCQEQLARCP